MHGLYVRYDTTTIKAQITNYIDLSSPKLISSVNVLLLEAENDWAEVLIVCEIVPVLCAVEILLVGFLLHRCEPKGTVLLGNKVLLTL